MSPSEILLFLAIVSVMIGVTAAIAIGAEMQRRGHRIAWPLYNVLLFRWVHRYHLETRAETGRPGPLFWWFVGGMNGAWLLAVGGLVLRG